MTIETVHPPIMARVLVYPSLDILEAVEGTCNQGRLRSACTDLSLCCAQILLQVLSCTDSYNTYYKSAETSDKPPSKSKERFEYLFPEPQNIIIIIIKKVKKIKRKKMCIVNSGMEISLRPSTICSMVVLCMSQLLACRINQACSYSFQLCFDQRVP